MASRNPHRPNVLFILTDDQGYWAMGCAGNKEIRTPNLDRLAATGIRFSDFFCASPVCSPARASIMTGRIPSQHGIHDWIRHGNSTVDRSGTGHPIEYLKGQLGYTDILAANGYVCGISGKWHLGDSHHPQKSFRFWQVHATGGGPYYAAPMVHEGQVYTETRYVTDAITDNALTFLEHQQASESPFYLSVHYTAPHSPWGRDEHPKDVYDDYHANCPFDSVPRDPIYEWQIDSAPYGYDETTRRDILSGYFAAVTEMDRNVGRLLSWLNEQQLLSNTLVCFTSDNGMNMGHHGIYGKGNGTFPLNMYDTSVKVPMLISRSGYIPEGQVCDVILSHYDLFPTLLDYLGLPNPEAERLPGMSFASLLRGEEHDGHREVVIYDEYGPVRMVRTREWKYVHRYPYGPHELYHLVEDPDERINLYGELGTEELVLELRAQLYKWYAKWVDPALDGAREAVTGKGQLDLVKAASSGVKTFEDDWHYLKQAQADAE